MLSRHQNSKPTARGQVLSRFMGLDFLKRKEEAAKELYSAFSKGMISNVYSSEKLKTDNETKQQTIVELTEQNKELNKTLIDTQDRIIKGQEYRDELLKKKHNDIDTEISTLSPTSVNSEIEKLETSKEGFVKLINELNIVEPTEFYKEDEHDKVKEEYTNLNKVLIQTETKIEEIGPQNFIEMYLDWLEELLNDLEDSNDIEGIKRYDTVLNARFALEVIGFYEL